MADTPLNGKLLRRTPGADNGTGYNDAKEWWYDRVTRTAAVYVIYGSADFSSFSLSPLIIIDRWCVSVGTAPFTEIQVTHLGSTGTVIQTAVDNVATCQIRCTIGLTATASATVNGRADITATATGAVGDVRFSLDGFDTAGIAPVPGSGSPTATFPQLVTGAYTVSVKETRPLGCSASQNLTLAAVYAPRYNLSFIDLDNVACQLQIFEREYNGTTVQLTAAATPVRLDWSGGALDHVYSKLIKGSSAELGLYVTAAEPLNPLFSGDERLHRVDVSRAGSLIWRGYLLPEQYDVLHLAGTSGVTLTATDGLGTLSTVLFNGLNGQRLRGDWTLVQVVQHCLGKLACTLPLDVLFNLFPASANPLIPAVEQIRVDVAAYQDDKGVAWDCNRVLAELLLPFQARLYQQNGTWRLERIIELTTGPLAMIRYAAGTYTGGTAQTPAGVLTTIGPAGQRPYWQGASQRQSLRGAVSRVSIAAAPGKIVNLLRFALPANADIPGPYPIGWSGYSNTPATPYSQLIYQGTDKPAILRLTGMPGLTPNSYPNAAASNAALAAAPWVQTPPSRPLPGPGNNLPGHSGENLTLRVTLTPYNNTPQALFSGLQNSLMAFAVHYGTSWFGASVGTSPESATTPALIGYEFTDTKPVVLVFNLFVTAQVGPQPVYLRIYAPVGGASACTVDVAISLSYESNLLDKRPGYTSTYTGDTRQLVSRADTGTTLFHTDTADGRFDGTLLDAGGVPAVKWGSPAQPGQYREVGDYLTAARLSWQLAPAQTISGLLRGPALGIGALLTDPQEQFQGVYLLTTGTYDVAEATWQVAGVQLLPLTPDTQTAPNTAIAYEDIATFWADEAGVLLTYDA